ncbi:hypothetical protein K474DRAFT_1713677 [Panus rudis PR-1116 ss-1]|nr:hypothetical protein K474DRAFT_1713677 [Panus rudis PR-1116 ss-1]
MFSKVALITLLSLTAASTSVLAQTGNVGSDSILRRELFEDISRRASYDTLQRREFIDLLARAVAEDEESGAGLWSGLLRIGGNLLGGLFGGGGGNDNQQRDFDDYDIQQRDFYDDLSKRAYDEALQRRELVELIARAVAEDDESGAGLFSGLFRIGSELIGPLLGGGGGGNDNQNQQRDFYDDGIAKRDAYDDFARRELDRRELIELIARAAAGSHHRRDYSLNDLD